MRTEICQFSVLFHVRELEVRTTAWIICYSAFILLADRYDWFLSIQGKNWWMAKRVFIVVAHPLHRTHRVTYHDSAHAEMYVRHGFLGSCRDARVGSLFMQGLRLIGAYLQGRGNSYVWFSLFLVTSAASTLDYRETIMRTLIAVVRLR